MKTYIGLTAICSITVLASCNKEDVPSQGTTVPRPAICRVSPQTVAKTGAPPRLGDPTRVPGFPLQLCTTNLEQGLLDEPCSCADYNGQYPDAPTREEIDPGIRTGVFDGVVTRVCHNGGNPQVCEDGMPLEGCSNDFFDGLVIYAWPDCATIAQASGTVFGNWKFANDDPIEVSGDDDDFVFNICPVTESMTVRMPNGDWMQKELREPGSFEARGSFGPPGMPGHLHIETQGCRNANTIYQINDTPSGPVRSFKSRPLPGDLVTAAGDWGIDRYHEINEGTPWIEIHENRITAVARRSPAPEDGTVVWIFVSSTLLQFSGQADLVEADALVPKPPGNPNPGMKWRLQSCEKNSPLVVKKPQCAEFPAGHAVVEPNPDIDSCHITVDKININLSEFGGRRWDNGRDCSDQCSGDFEDPGDCDRVAYVGAIKATWTQVPETAALPAPDPEDPSAPGDLWMCNSCACADPASPFTMFMPQTGCAQTGLDPANFDDQQTACNQVCGNFVCTPFQSCRTGLCQRPPIESPISARMVGRNACIPGQRQGNYRLTTATSYHVTLTPFNPATGQGSQATFTSGAQQTPNVPLNGQLSMDVMLSQDAMIPVNHSILNITNLELTPADFTLGKSMTQNKVFIAQRGWATFTGQTQFAVAPFTAVLGFRSLMDGLPVGINQENSTPALGTFDPATRTFILDIQVQDVDDGEPRSMTAHLVGTIDNLPPNAVITGAPDTIECGVPAVLSAASSSDPDPGDTITRYQWLAEDTPGGIAQTTNVLSSKLGRTDYHLRVYDRKMAASHAEKHITVVDTKAPVFTFVPANMTVRACAGLNIGQATATDTCSAVTVTNNAPPQFTVGQTTVTWTARDTSGNTRTATQIVTVELGDDPSCCPAGSHIIVGTSNNDVLNGTAGVDCILGKGAQDQIFGRGGNDFISGGDGDDIINGEDGNDVIFGGSGQDQITGGNGNDTINGGDGDDVCRGSGGNDVIHGNQGQDRLFGEDATDSLFGDDGDDTLDGGAGNDALNGGGIHDTCIGGTGTNTFTLCETRR